MSNNAKISIRFFNDREVRAVWDEEICKGLTNKINDRKTYMKGIDYSYYYEENEESYG